MDPSGKSELLPAQITSIQPQKNNRNRYSIFVKEEFLIGVSEITLLEFALIEEQEITPRLFSKIQKAEGRGKVKSYCLERLGQRDHSRKELFDKASRKDFPSDIVNAVLDELEEKGYLNNRVFAEKFVSDKLRINRWSPAKIKAHLARKGIDRRVSDDIVETVFSDIDMEELLTELVGKKKRTFAAENDFFRRKKKIFDYLKRKGYRSSTIMNHIEKLVESVNS